MPRELIELAIRTAGTADLEDGLAGRLVQLGIRTMNRHQHDQAVRHGVEVIDMKSWSAGIRPRVKGPVYLARIPRG